MNARRILWILPLLIVVVGASFLVSVWRGLYRSDIEVGAPTTRVEIPSGSSLIGAAQRLESAGLLDHAWQLRWVARIEGGARDVKAGAYDIPVGTSPAEILRVLVAGEVATVTVTLLEGWLASRITTELSDSLRIEATTLDSLVRNPPPVFRERLSLPEGISLEGYLFPDTYRFAEGLDPVDLLQELVGTLLANLDAEMEAQREALGWTWHEVLSLAAIVEAEATRDDERARVAAVYHNRLRKGWKLEADPTVAYALGKTGERLLFRDLEVDSAYNTYRNTGLPPGPINNPGLASIRAVLAPAPGFEAMYFVADGQGGHVFSRTWAEHSRAVAEYRRLMRERRGP